MLEFFENQFKNTLLTLTPRGIGYSYNIEDRDCTLAHIVLTLWIPDKGKHIITKLFDQHEHYGNVLCSPSFLVNTCIADIWEEIDELCEIDKLKTNKLLLLL